MQTFQERISPEKGRNAQEFGHGVKELNHALRLHNLQVVGAACIRQWRDSPAYVGLDSMPCKI